MIPEVSVIIPAYNVAAYVAECLESISHQTFDDFEAIVVDDGSTDGTDALVDSFAQGDGRFRVIHKGNAGVSCARNTGIAEARGRYLSFVDADDVLHPDFLSTLYDCATDTGSSLVMCDYYKLVDGKAQERRSFPADTPKHLNELGYWDLSRVAPTACVTLWNKLYARDVFDRVSFREGILFEDLDAMWRIVSVCPSIVVVNRPLYYYRSHASSITGSASHICHLDACESLLLRDGYFRDKGWVAPRLDNLCQLTSQMAYAWEGLRDANAAQLERFRAYRVRTRTLCRELLGELGLDPHLLSHAVPYLMGERVFCAASRLSKRLHRP